MFTGRNYSERNTYGSSRSPSQHRPYPSSYTDAKTSQSPPITHKSTTTVHPPISTHKSWIEVLNKPPTQHGKLVGDVFGLKKIKHPMAFDREPPHKRNTNSKTTDTKQLAQEKEFETKEWYHHVTSIETNDEHQQRTRTGYKDIIEDDVLFTKADSANLLRAKPSPFHASISTV